VAPLSRTSSRQQRVVAVDLRPGFVRVPGLELTSPSVHPMRSGAVTRRLRNTYTCEGLTYKWMGAPSSKPVTGLSCATRSQWACGREQKCRSRRFRQLHRAVDQHIAVDPGTTRWSAPRSVWAVLAWLVSGSASNWPPNQLHTSAVCWWQQVHRWSLLERAASPHESGWWNTGGRSAAARWRPRRCSLSCRGLPGLVVKGDHCQTRRWQTAAIINAARSL
jgi:hypothetical protein